MSSAENLKFGLVGGGEGVIVQPQLFVDSVTGSDSFDGTTPVTAVRTLAELSRRLEGRVLDPSLPAFTIQAAGTFPGQALSIGIDSPSAIPIDIIAAAPAQVAAGAITAYQQSNSVLRGSVTDAAQNFTGLAPARIRTTSGAASGALTWFNSIGGATIANTGQFERIAAPGGTISTSNPIATDAYVVETLVTQIESYDIRVSGRGIVTLHGFMIGSSTGGVTPRSRAACSAQSRCRLFGCLFNGNNQLIEGNQVLAGCANTCNALNLSSGFFTLQGHCAFHNLATFIYAGVTGNRCLHDGNGANAVAFNIGNNSYVEDIGDRGFFGSLGGAALVTVEDDAKWVINAGANTFWGAAGNTAAAALRVHNGSGVSYVTKPTAAGVAPGTDVILANAAAIAWAAVPALAAAPDNAFVNVRQ